TSAGGSPLRRRAANARDRARARRTPEGTDAGRAFAWPRAGADRESLLHPRRVARSGHDDPAGRPDGGSRAIGRRPRLYFAIRRCRAERDRERFLARPVAAKSLSWRSLERIGAHG